MQKAEPVKAPSPVPAEATSPAVVAPPSRVAAAPFVWLNAPLPKALQATFAAKFLAMHQHEIKERASLLRRLGYDQATVQNRLERYMVWEYEPFHRPALIGVVSKLVTAVYAPTSARGTGSLPVI